MMQDESAPASETSVMTTHVSNVRDITNVTDQKSTVFQRQSNTALCKNRGWSRIKKININVSDIANKSCVLNKRL